MVKWLGLQSPEPKGRARSHSERILYALFKIYENFCIWVFICEEYEGEIIFHKKLVDLNHFYDNVNISNLLNLVVNFSKFYLLDLFIASSLPLWGEWCVTFDVVISCASPVTFLVCLGDPVLFVWCLDVVWPLFGDSFSWGEWPFPLCFFLLAAISACWCLEVWILLEDGCWLSKVFGRISTVFVLGGEESSDFCLVSWLRFLGWASSGWLEACLKKEISKRPWEWRSRT
jgi:hypothetical protein